MKDIRAPNLLTHTKKMNASLFFGLDIKEGLLYVLYKRTRYMMMTMFDSGPPLKMSLRETRKSEFKCSSSIFITVERNLKQNKAKLKIPPG